MKYFSLPGQPLKNDDGFGLPVSHWKLEKTWLGLKMQVESGKELQYVGDPGKGPPMLQENRQSRDVSHKRRPPKMTFPLNMLNQLIVTVV